MHCSTSWKATKDPLSLVGATSAANVKEATTPTARKQPWNARPRSTRGYEVAKTVRPVAALRAMDVQRRQRQRPTASATIPPIKLPRAAPGAKTARNAPLLAQANDSPQRWNSCWRGCRAAAATQTAKPAATHIKPTAPDANHTFLLLLLLLLPGAALLLQRGSLCQERASCFSRCSSRCCFCSCCCSCCCAVAAGARGPSAAPIALALR